LTELREFGCVISGNIPSLIKDALFLEKTGFDHVWLSDHVLSLLSHLEFADAWTVLTAIGVKTKRIRLSTGVSDPYRRHPVTLAHSAATLDHLTNGRVALGIGAGEAMNLIPFGIKWRKPVTTLREAIIVIKKLFEATPENPANFKGEIFNLRNAYLQILPVQKPRLPIYVGALSSKTRELTGELADGWYPWIETPETLKKHLMDIKNGLKKAGRKIDEIDVVANFKTAVTDDYEEALKAVSGEKMALILERSVAKELGYEIEIPEEVKIQQIIPRSKNVDIMYDAMKQIPQELVEKITVIGTVDQCIDKIERYLKAGATSVTMFNCGPNVKKTYEIYRDEIIPYFKETYGRGQ